MGDDSLPETDPPLVRRVEPAPPVEVVRVVARVMPKPGFFEAILWCVIFLLVELVTAGFVLVLFLLACSARSPDPGQFLKDQINQFADANQENTVGVRPAAPEEFNRGLAYGMLAAPVPVLGLILVVLPFRIGKGWRRQLAFRWPNGLQVALVLMILPGFIILTSGLESLLHFVGVKLPDTGQTLGIFSGFPWYLSFLAVGFGPGLVEELWCRGFIGRGLSARYGLVIGVTLTSIMFGLLHGSLAYAIPPSLMGAYLHFVYLSSRSIWLSVLLHTLNNSVAVLAMLTGLGERLESVSNQVPVLVLGSSFVLVLSASVALWTGRPRLVPGVGRVEELGTGADWHPEYPGISLPPPESGLELRPGRANRVALTFAIITFVDLLFLLTW